ncbi:MAG: DUF4214 domain-containing protein [Pseudomonadota bacterium]
MESDTSFDFTVWADAGLMDRPTAEALSEWLFAYMRDNVGVEVSDGVSQQEAARLESYFANESNTVNYLQAFMEQPFYDDYMAVIESFMEGDGADVGMLPGGELPDDELPEETPAQQQLPETLVEDMALLYQAALDRVPDMEGLNYFVSNLRGGQSLQEVAHSFYQADEFRGQFEEFDDASYINQLYENVLGREADQAGLDYWLDDIQNNGRSHAEVLVSFAQSEENRGNADDWLAGLQFDTGSDEWIL